MPTLLSRLGNAKLREMVDSAESPKELRHLAQRLAWDGSDICRKYAAVANRILKLQHQTTVRLLSGDDEDASDALPRLLNPKLTRATGNVALERELEDARKRHRRSIIGSTPERDVYPRTKKSKQRDIDTESSEVPQEGHAVDTTATIVDHSAALSDETETALGTTVYAPGTPVFVTVESSADVSVSETVSGDVTDAALPADPEPNDSHRIPQAVWDDVAALIECHPSLFSEVTTRAYDVRSSIHGNLKARVLVADFMQRCEQFERQWGAGITEICQYLREPGTGDDTAQIREGRASVLELSKLMGDIATALFEDARHHHVRESRSRNPIAALAISECLQCESDDARTHDLQKEIACLIGISSSVDAFMRADTSPESSANDELRNLISSSVIQGLWLDYLQKRFPLLDGSTKLIDHLQMKERWEGEVKRVFDCVHETLKVVAEKANALRDVGNQDPGIPRLLKALATASEALRQLLHLGTFGDIGSGSPVHLDTASFRDCIPQADIVSFEGISDDQSGKNFGGQSRLRAIATSLRFGSHDALQIRVHTSQMQSSDSADDASVAGSDTVEAPLVVCHRIGGPPAFPGNLIPIRDLGLPSVIGETAEKLKGAADSGLVFLVATKKTSAEGALNTESSLDDRVIVCERKNDSHAHAHFLLERESAAGTLETDIPESGPRLNGFSGIGPLLRGLGYGRKGTLTLAPATEENETEKAEVSEIESDAVYVHRMLFSKDPWHMKDYEVMWKEACLKEIRQTSHDGFRGLDDHAITTPSRAIKDREIEHSKMWQALKHGDLEALARWFLSPKGKKYLGHLSPQEKIKRAAHPQLASTE